MLGDRVRKGTAESAPRHGQNKRCLRPESVCKHGSICTWSTLKKEKTVYQTLEDYSYYQQNAQAMEHLLPFPFPNREDDLLLSLLGQVEPVRGKKMRCAGQCTSKQDGDRWAGTPLSTSFLFVMVVAWAPGRPRKRPSGHPSYLQGVAQQHLGHAGESYRRDQQG